jgi:hypothetical protein
MLIAHVAAGVLVLLVVIHRIALVVRRHDKVAIRSVLATGSMPKWYVKKNHKVWYEEIIGRGASDVKEPKEPIKTQKPEDGGKMDKEITEESIASDEKPAKTNSAKEETLEDEKTASTPSVSSS